MEFSGEKSWGRSAYRMHVWLITVWVKVSIRHLKPNIITTPPFFVLQQSRNFSAVGEAVVAIETDACCQSFVAAHPLLLTFHHERLALRHIEHLFLWTLHAYSDLVKRTHGPTHYFFSWCSRGISDAAPIPKYAGKVTAQLSQALWSSHLSFSHS